MATFIARLRQSWEEELREEARRTPNRCANDDGRRQVHLDKLRHVAAARFRQLCAALFARAEPAGPIRDELAYRDHRREIDGTARGPNPRADHLFRTRVVIGVSFSCRNADGLSAALFQATICRRAMPPGYPCNEPSALPGGDTKDLRRRIVPETPGGKGDRRQQRLQITRRHVHIQTLFIKPSIAKHASSSFGIQQKSKQSVM